MQATQVAFNQTWVQKNFKFTQKFKWLIMNSFFIYIHPILQKLDSYVVANYALVLINPEIANPWDITFKNKVKNTYLYKTFKLLIILLKRNQLSICHHLYIFIA
jgi:hypothetical protein